ncbi:hypothetical protein [Streptomyces mirabilis]|uniref:hypothetical protein n=1 Tax=Streptomyces mirabilis TaxID=68239 RepID=UPI0036ACEFCE
MFSKGKHRAGPENGRLRHELKLAEGRIAWYRSRLLALSKKHRTLEAQAEITDGLVEKQLIEIQRRDARIAQLERELAERTVEMPLPKLPEPELAGATT